jgi:hypothetical protein
MRRWMAVLDVTCARVNPGLLLVAVAIALLDLTFAVQRWRVAHPAPPALVRTVVATDAPGRDPPVLPPELRDMVGRD